MRAIYPADCVSLILSDAVGDSLESIASGPTVVGEVSFPKVWDIIGLLVC